MSNKKLFIIGIGKHAINLVKSAAISSNIINNARANPRTITVSDTWNNVKSTVDSVYTNNNNGTLDVFSSNFDGNLNQYLPQLLTEYTNSTFIIIHDKVKWDSRLGQLPWSGSDLTQVSIDAAQGFVDDNSLDVNEFNSRTLSGFTDSGVPLTNGDFPNRKSSSVKFFTITNA